MFAKNILLIIALLSLLILSMLAVIPRLSGADGIGNTQPQGLVGYWNFDQGAGTIAYDSSGYNNHGTIYGASWTSGKVNGALSFDGTKEYVDCGNNETLDPTQGATIEAWVKFNQLPSAAKHIMSIAGRSGSGTDLDLQTETDDKFKFYIDGSKLAVSNTVAETNKWYHIAGTYQANNYIKIYVNGVLEKTTSIGVTRGTNPNNFSIGPSLIFPGRFFNGTIDEVKIFNRALSAGEIGAEYMHVSILPQSDVVDVDQSTLFTSSLYGGTSPYTYQWYLSDTLVSDATSSSWTFTPHSSGSYTVYVNATDNVGARAKSSIATVTVNPKPSPSSTPTATPESTPTPGPTATPEQTPTVTPPPSASSVATVSDNSATVDQISTTGVSITASGSSLQDGTQIDVSSTNYGGNQPEGTGIVPVDPIAFYLVNVTSNGGALGSEVSGAVSVSNPSFNSDSVIEYWSRNNWTSAVTTFTAPDTVSCIIPASDLAGTPILVGNPKSSTSPSALGATSLLIIAVIAIIVIFGILFVYLRKRKAT